MVNKKYWENNKIQNTLQIISSIERILKQIESLVDKILAVKNENPQADTGTWEREIDGLVYRLYDLTEKR